MPRYQFGIVTNNSLIGYGDKGDEAQAGHDDYQRLAHTLAKRIDTIIFLRVGDPNILEYLHVRLVFMLYMSQHRASGAERSRDHFPWDIVALCLNAVAASLPLEMRSSLASDHFDADELTASVATDWVPLREDFAMRGLPWSDDYVSEEWFTGSEEEICAVADGFHPPAPEWNREKRVLFLGHRLARSLAPLAYDSTNDLFCAVPEELFPQLARSSQDATSQLEDSEGPCDGCTSPNMLGTITSMEVSAACSGQDSIFATGNVASITAEAGICPQTHQPPEHAIQTTISQEGVVRPCDLEPALKLAEGSASGAEFTTSPRNAYQEPTPATTPTSNPEVIAQHAAQACASPSPPGIKAPDSGFKPALTPPESSLSPRPGISPREPDASTGDKSPSQTANVGSLRCSHCQRTFRRRCDLK